MSIDLHIEPSLTDIAARAQRQIAEEALLGHARSLWREKTRLELGLVTDRPIIATGHQTLLWHPGILAKYLVMDAVADLAELGRANLIVDQHVDDYGGFDVPIRRRDGSLAARTIELTPVQKDVPMGLQRPFTAPQPPTLPFAGDSVATGVCRIIETVNAHTDAPNAALQMARALSELMRRWVRPVTHVTATDLGQTALSRALLKAIAEDPHTCAEAYNAAITQVSEAGIEPLLIREDYVEVPLWRVRPDGRRMRAYDNDVHAVLEDHALPPLLPRALFMTALVRLGMCDVFIHGTGGANYDRAMELWIRNWLGVEVAPIAVASATLYLPIDQSCSGDGPSLEEIERARHEARHAWHDPQAAATGQAPGPTKSAMLKRIDALPQRSPQRKALFFAMHRQLEQLRADQSDCVEQFQQRLDAMQRAIADRKISRRRDWPFPLYPQDMIDALADQVAVALA